MNGAFLLSAAAFSPSKIRSLTIGTILLSAVAATPAFADVVSVADGSFESNPIGQIKTLTPTSTGWYMSSGAPYSTYGYTWILNNLNTGAAVKLHPFTPTDEGVQFLAQDSTYHPAAVNQEITGLTPGNMYTVSFGWAGAQQLGYTGATTDFWAVSLGSQTFDTKTVSVASGGFSGWMSEKFRFTATAADEVLSFQAFGTCLAPGATCSPTTSGAPPFALLDSVALTSTVPEPSSWAMMLIGFAGLGYAGFRSRRRAVSIA
jgi:hypothetical protein